MREYNLSHSYHKQYQTCVVYTGLLYSVKDDNNHISTPILEQMKAKSQQITVWAQCFALYVSVMAKEYLECVSELMAYMCTIIRAS